MHAMWKNPYADLLEQHQFVRFGLARTIGTLANQMLMVAVAWQMYDLTASAWDLGLVGLFQFVPALAQRDHMHSAGEAAGA